MASANTALRSSLDGDRQSSADKLTHSLEQIQHLEQSVTELRSALQEKEGELSALNISHQTLENSFSQVSENLQLSEESGKNEAKQLSDELSTLRQDMQSKITSLEESLETAVREREAEKVLAKETREQTEATSKRLVEVEGERERLVRKLEEVQSQLNKTTGALEFAEGEMQKKNSAVQTISQVLEEKKTAITELTMEISSIKSDGAAKLTDVVQKNEELLKLNALLEKGLSEKEAALRVQASEMERSKKLSEELQEKLALAEEQLQIAQTQLELVEKEKASSLTEREGLCGQVDSLSQLQTELKERCRKQDELVAQLKANALVSSAEISDYRTKLQRANQQLSQTVREWKDSEHTAQGQLERYEKENRQMKKQFDSAITLMETKASEQSQVLNRMRESVKLKEEEIARLKEQIASNTRTIGELRERVIKATADYKISSERCRLMEQECQQLQVRVRELELELGQAQVAVSDVTAERESLSSEHRALLNGMQEHEKRTLEMTNQVAELAREKEGTVHVHIYTCTCTCTCTCTFTCIYTNVHKDCNCVVVGCDVNIECSYTMYNVQCTCTYTYMDRYTYMYMYAV